MAVNALSQGAWLAKLAASLDDSPGLLIKTGAGMLHGWSVVGAGAGYVQVFDAAALTDVTLGTTTPDFAIPVSTTFNSVVGMDWPFSLGCVVFCATTATGATGQTANGTFSYA